MALPGRGTTLHVRRLRIAGQADATLRPTLATADLYPDVSPCSIACVRSFGAPAWRSWREARGSEARRAWQTNVRRTLGEVVQRAALPADGSVPAGAQAVVFRDEAELLACLAMDCAAGVADTRWWWRLLLGSVNGRAAFVQTWLESSAFVPAALECLARQHQAVRVVRLLRPIQARALLLGVLRSHALNHLIDVSVMSADMPPAVAAGVWRHDVSPPAARVATLRVLDGITSPTPAYAPLAPPVAGWARANPWQAWVPEASNPTLDINQQLLLGLALMLRRAPAAIRAQSFAAAVTRWRAAVASCTAAPDATPPSSAARTYGVEFDPCSDVTPNPKDDPPPEGAPEVGFDLPSEVAPELEDHPHSAVVPGVVFDLPLEGAPNVEHNPRTAVTPGVAFHLPSEVAPTVEDDAPAEGAPEVEFGLRSADITRVDFDPRSAPVAPDAATPPWLTPVDLAPTATRADDTVAPWPALTAESSTRLAPITEAPTPRVNTAFGGLFYLINLAIALGLYADFTQPLRPGIEVCLWDFLALLGVRLLGGKLRSDPLWQLLAALAGRSVDQPPGAEFDPASLSAWLDTLTPRVRTALRRAIGPTGRRRVGPFVCAHRAVVLVTAGHLDVVLSLTDLPIAIRIAGLDRDPGWVPAAGRSIAFHFE